MDSQLGEIMAMEIKHLQTSEADEISRLRAESAELKANVAQLEDNVAFWKKKLDDEMESRRDEYEEAEKEIRRLKRALWKLKALYFYRMFQWCKEGKRLAPEDDEPEDFFMECLGKHTKRKSEWGKEADMFDNARIVCIKKSEEYNV